MSKNTFEWEILLLKEAVIVRRVLNRISTVVLNKKTFQSVKTNVSTATSVLEQEYVF